MTPMSIEEEDYEVTPLRSALRSNRAQFRPTAEQKELFLRAASLEGQSLSEFMRLAVEERAKRVIAEHERLVLNETSRETFLSALVRPPKPNERLKALADRYAREVTSRP